MKVTLDPYRFRNTPLLELPALVADLGYQYIELSPRRDGAFVGRVPGSRTIVEPVARPDLYAKEQ